MQPSLEPSVTVGQELIVPPSVITIGSMDESQELVDFSRRMNEICDDKGLPQHGRQSALGRIFHVSQKGARKWLEAESFPRWEHIIRIAQWGGVTVEWLMTGRLPKSLDALYPTKAIAHVAQVMQAMEPAQQYKTAQMVDLLAQPAPANDHHPDIPNNPTSAGGQ